MSFSNSVFKNNHILYFLLPWHTCSILKPSLWVSAITSVQILSRRGIAFVLAEDTAAVGLEVETAFPGHSVALFVEVAIVHIVKGDACQACGLLCGPLDEFVFLVGAEEEGGAKGVKAMPLCVSCGG